MLLPVELEILVGALHVHISTPNITLLYKKEKKNLLTCALKVFSNGPLLKKF